MWVEAQRDEQEGLYALWVDFDRKLTLRVHIFDAHTSVTLMDFAINEVRMWDSCKYTDETINEAIDVAMRIIEKTGGMA